MRAPEPCGPLSEAVLSRLSGPPGPLGALPRAAGDPLDDDDLQLALYACYELHYEGFEGMDERWEWEPGLLAVRATLERAFERRLLEEVPREPEPARDLDRRLRAIVAADEGPHTFTVVAKKDEPRTAQQLFGCKICEKLAKAHGADPNSNAPPKYPFLENGVGQAKPSLVDQPGDSGVTGKGKKGESIDLKVTAPSGTKLYFMCLIHPWMQAEVDVT